MRNGYPRYVSHKEVGAAKVTGVEQGADGAVTVHLEGFPSVRIPHEEVRHKPQPHAGMYLIEYADEYVSFLPAKAFEEGYSPLATDEVEEQTEDPAAPQKTDEATQTDEHAAEDEQGA